MLLVANKYHSRFDQFKLCAMYVIKKLRSVSAVRTLSRLNRIRPPFEKKTFVLDFVNSYEDIKDAFAPYYTTTLLSNSVTPTAIYDLETTIDAYTFLDPDDIEKANELLYKENISSKDKQKVTFYFKRAKNTIEQYELIKQHEIMAMMRPSASMSSFCRYPALRIRICTRNTTSSLICWLTLTSSIRVAGITSTAKSKRLTSCIRKPKNAPLRIW